MVHKNIKFGNVNGVTLIELGKGNVRVACIKNPGQGYTGVQFVNDTSKPAGGPQNTIGTTTDDSRPDAIITFTDTKSIEVVERALRKAKTYLNDGEFHALKQAMEKDKETTKVIYTPEEPRTRKLVRGEGSEPFINPDWCPYCNIECIKNWVCLRCNRNMREYSTAIPDLNMSTRLRHRIKALYIGSHNRQYLPENGSLVLSLFDELTGHGEWKGAGLKDWAKVTLYDLSLFTEQFFLSQRNLGEGSLKELKSLLKEQGLKLKNQPSLIKNQR